MPKPPGQSDFVITRPPAEVTDEVGVDGQPVLPEARLRSSEASASATKIMLTLTMIMFVVLFVVSVIAPHIPSGESP